MPILDLLRELLEDEGYRVLTARNGQEGLRLLEAARPQLVLADVMMPLLDGRSLCRAMQADARYRSIPVILMSAVAEPYLNIQDCAYTAFLTKPFDPDRVLAVIGSLVG